ncbi:LexA repressor [bioreactor metagenome]|uniref:LexA repressor n=1 Tax=bioreactor metagenome TaxID=1076179 RepID=A0A645D116_9ZZZZ
MRIEDYIREYRAAKQLTQQEVADACGLSKGYISMLENGRNPKTGQPIVPSLTSLKQIAAGTGIDLNDLLAAIDGDQEVSLEDSRMNDILSLPGIEPPPRWVKKPLLGSIACGVPILAQENIEDYILVPENIHCDFLLRCKGDSMINARILDGDIVMIRHQEDVENGEIAAVRIDGEVTLKRVYKHPGMVQLMPENPVYPPMIYNNGNCSEISIVGKAIAFLSLVR